MVKLMGSLFILAGGGLLWRLQMQNDRRHRSALLDLVASLRSMGEEIRMARTPMPRLLQRLAERRGEDVQAFLRSVAAAAENGEGLTASWKKGIMELPLGGLEREILLSVELQGDEEKVCKGLSLAALQLAQCAEELERRRPEEAKRTSALCFSCAALLVILLI